MRDKTMQKYDEIKKLREQGKTYQQIADELGVSTQVVSAALKKANNNFKVFTKERCIYVNIRYWLNTNRITINDFITLLGLIVCESTRWRYRRMLNGFAEPSKGDIDRILEITGLTYEQAFIEG